MQRVVGSLKEIAIVFCGQRTLTMQGSQGNYTFPLSLTTEFWMKPVVVVLSDLSGLQKVKVPLRQTGCTTPAARS